MLAGLLLGYAALLAAVTLVVWARHGRRADRATHFVAARRLSAFTTGCSLAATSVGGSSIIVATALVYRHGLPGIWMDLSGAVGFLLLGLLLARRVRATGVSSIAELAGVRYGVSTRRLVAAVVLVVELGWLALQAKATSAVLGPSLPAVPEAVLEGALLGFVVLYTLLGGQYAVSYADVAQLGVMLAGLGLVAPLAVARALGPDRLAALPLAFPTGPTFGASEIASYLLLMGLPHFVGSDIYAKILSARDGRAAARGALLGALFKAILAASLALTALGGAVLVPDLASPSDLLGVLLARVLPGPAAALLVVATVAAMQSTASQVLLSAVTMVGNDLFPSSGRAMVALATVAAGLFALGACALFPTVIDLMKVAYAVFASGLSLPIVASLVPTLRPPPWAARAAILVGSAAGGGLHVAKLLGVLLPADPILLGTTASACILALGLASKRTPG
jgi:solute:Na+ symporter, SSS family